MSQQAQHRSINIIIHRHHIHSLPNPTYSLRYSPTHSTPTKTITPTHVQPEALKRSTAPLAGGAAVDVPAGAGAVVLEAPDSVIDVTVPLELVLCAADGELEFEAVARVPVDSGAEMELDVGEDRVVVTKDVGRDVVTVSVAMMTDEGEAEESMLDTAEPAEADREERSEDTAEAMEEEAPMIFVDITLMGLIEGLKKVTLAVAETLLTAAAEEERTGAVRVGTGTTVGPLNVTDSVSVGMSERVETSIVVEGRTATDGDKDAAALAKAEDILGAYVPG